MKKLSILLGFWLLGLGSTGMAVAVQRIDKINSEHGVGKHQSFDSPQERVPKVDRRHSEHDIDKHQNFDSTKQRIEQRIQDNIAKLQGELICVQSAQNSQDIHVCSSDRGQRGRPRAKSVR